MLEVKNLTFQVQENGVESKLVKTSVSMLQDGRDACH